MRNIILVFAFLAACSRNKDKIKSNPATVNRSDSISIPVTNKGILDKISFKINDGLNYSITVLDDDHIYRGPEGKDSIFIGYSVFFKVNETDSVMIDALGWEGIDSENIYDENVTLKRCIPWNDSTIFIAVPVYGATELYPVVKRNGQYFIKKYGPPQNILTSFNLFIVDTKRRLAFVPRTRAHAFENGQIETWRYNDKKNKWTMLSARFFIDPITKKEIFPDFYEEEIVKRVLKEFKY
jgi:hypothetical protein